MWLNGEVVIHTIRLPKQSAVGDLINYLKTKVGFYHKYAELRLLEVFYHKIYKVVNTDGVSRMDINNNEMGKNKC
ncbi:unnamed protein product [Lactuca virosa]|uniref:ubiquitinyl hydrolase 1 n=1 Tax=Lactuca virosa TaxID=75947 RepID=A0AAU9M6H7_9ASTR|nr:unnamed protein product [Lactuca virosa]